MTDARTMSHMAPELREVHIRLEAWGRWARSAVPRAWPTRTLLGRIEDEGPASSHATAPSDPLPDYLAPVEAAVCHLGDLDRCVIRETYVRWEPPEVVARRCRLPLRRYRAVLTRARWRISGFLAAKRDY